jgi:hypothetical protein
VRNPSGGVPRWPPAARPGPRPVRERRAMATREELIREAGERAHHNEMTYFG